MKKLHLLAAVILVPLLAAGCGMLARSGASLNAPPGSYVSPNPAPPDKPDSQTVTLFFADFQAQYVMPEKREVTPGGRMLAEVVVEELLKGPEDPYLHRGIPQGITINQVELDASSGTAVVDFNQNVVEKFPQGSAGSAMFFSSLIFSLTNLAGVEQVAITVEGQTPEYLDQVDISGTASRGPIRTYPVFLDQDRTRWLQQEAEQGRQTWRLDPLQVARFDGQMFGFATDDAFTLLYQDTKDEYASTVGAEVEAVHSDKHYVIQLIQPAKKGEKGIWAISGILEK